MKSRLLFSIALVCFIAITTPSCKKYVDGPSFSLRSKKARLCGDWKIESVAANSVDITAAFQALVGTYVVGIEKDGKYAITGNVADAGTWKLGEDGDDVLFTSSTAGVNPQSYRILKLKNKELWWKITQSNGDVDEFHFVPAK